jgi:hypothetical protein
VRKNGLGTKKNVNAKKKIYVADALSPPQRLQLAMIRISIEIHFTTLYMADLETRAELGEARVPSQY